MIRLSLYLNAGIRNFSYIAFCIKASHATSQGGTEQKLLMHEAGRGKMIFEDCIPLCSILSSSEALLCDSPLSATKTAPLVRKQLFAKRSEEAPHSTAAQTDRALSRQKQTSHSPRKQVEKVELSRPPSDV